MAEPLSANELHLVVVSKDNFLKTGTDYIFRLIRGDKRKITQKINDQYKDVRGCVDIISVEDWSEI